MGVGEGGDVAAAVNSVSAGAAVSVASQRSFEVLWKKLLRKPWTYSGWSPAARRKGSKQVQGGEEMAQCLLQKC